jgi:hypothetical protein
MIAALVAHESGDEEAISKAFLDPFEQSGDFIRGIHCQNADRMHKKVAVSVLVVGPARLKEHAVSQAGRHGVDLGRKTFQSSFSPTILGAEHRLRHRGAIVLERPDQSASTWLVHIPCYRDYNLRKRALNSMRRRNSMHPKTYSLLTSVIFTLIALGHLSRLVFRWSMLFGGRVVPLWANGVAVLIFAYLAYEGFRLARKLQ